MLIKFGAPSFDPSAEMDRAELSSQKYTKDQGVRVTPPSSVAVPVASHSQTLSSSPSILRGKSKEALALTVDSSSQTDDPVMSREKAGVYQDTAVQTDVAWELSSSRRTSVSSWDGSERMDSVATGW